MHRRELLGALGLGAVGAAGLVGSPADGAGEAAGTTTDGTTAGGTPSQGNDFDGIDSSADRPFAAITVGSRAGVRNPENNRPHLVRVWNDSDRARGLRLELRRGDGSVPVDRGVEFPADGYLSLRLFDPASYELTVSAVGGGATAGTDATASTASGTTTSATATSSADAAGETIRIPRTLFDCNDSRTDVRVGPDGAVASETVATEIGCPPAVVDRSFTAFRGTCGAADEAAVSFGEGSVAVEGSIRAPNPCHAARLADVAVTGPDELRVAVATVEPEAGYCAQCVGTVEYRADVGFRDRVPATVTVVHRGADATRTVATVSRGGTTATSESGGATGSPATTGTASDGGGASRTATTDAADSG